MIEAVLFDFGGVILSSPFEAFAEYENEIGLPPDTIRKINTTNPDTNAWAQFERREVNPEEFVLLFEKEALSLGHELDAQRILGGLHGSLRPSMVEALSRCSSKFKTAMLTNNITPMHEQDLDQDVKNVVEIFDLLVESSIEGCRKPEEKFYEIACERLNVNPENCVFLDDLGINLKPARAMGMTTIKVVEPEEAIKELYEILGFTSD
ncbi:MAG: HAD-IA family hydrolase [Acidimicrobiales bacterium]|nr:HAD family hydrolase [Acidimicrobiaceae bacterium]MDP6323218.1 HAD-IA family hydrolase [Acidimicrobiales bacterium]HJM38217.1 HAD-IA family hydrolase [Acidimicrobiales bacterium]